MGLRKLLLCLSCVAILAVLGGYWLLDSRNTADGSALQPSAEDVAPDDAAAAGLSDAALAPLATQGDPERVDVAAEEQQQVAEALEVSRRWVQGKVAFSFAMPSEEQLHVLSLDGEYNERELYGKNATRRRSGMPRSSANGCLTSARWLRTEPFASRYPPRPRAPTWPWRAVSFTPVARAPSTCSRGTRI